jgi:holo-[acyl-carrier protein] synthase
MKIRVGIDIERIARFESLIASKNRGIVKKIFTPAELRYCLPRANAAAHLAARFAAKEAFMNVCRQMGGGQVSFRQIEISRRRDGAPMISCPCLPGTQVTVSLSHERECAVAVVVIYKL